MLSGSSHFTAGRSEVASALARPAALRSRKIPRSGGRVRAERKQQAPLPDVPKQKRRGGGGREWLQQLLSKFGPMTDRSPNTFVMDFEKPLVELDNRIREVRKVAEQNGVDVSEQIQELEERAKQLRRDTYSRLTATQRLQVARHPNRPTCLDIVMNITDRFIELHGDRAGLDDKAMIAGIGSIDGVSMMFIGHQKGRNTKENVERNFGMPQPNGFRKALRFMQHADKFGFPIVTFVDTPGAYAGLKAEELGQGEAIAVNLREMFGFRVPIISIVIGEGGSGGALAINCANKVLIMENAVYYVASPEACAAILWKSREKAGAAAKALKITPEYLLGMGGVDEIVPEPLGGAHSDPMGAFPAVKEAVMRWFNHYKDMSETDIMKDRYLRYRKFGLFDEYLVHGGEKEQAAEERSKAEGVRTEAGTWCVNEEERDYIQQTVDKDEEWNALMKSKSEWLQPPKFLGEEDIDEDQALAEHFLSLVKARKAEKAAEEAEAAAAAQLKENLDVVEKGLEGEIKENGTAAIEEATSR